MHSLVNSVGELISWLYMLFGLYCIWFTTLLLGYWFVLLDVVFSWLCLVCCGGFVWWLILVWFNVIRVVGWLGYCLWF